jgi:dCTP deaminase
MTKTDAMFWSGETSRERLAPLIEPFTPERVDCVAYTLAVGSEVYVSPNDQTADPTTITVRKLAPGDAFTIPPGQFAFLLTEEIVTVPADALAFFRFARRPSSAAWSMSRASMSIRAIAAN